MRRFLKRHWRIFRSKHRRRTQYLRPPRKIARVALMQSVNRPHTLQSLLAQTPGAARAQNIMDAHPGGYKNKAHRVMTLIEFNDTLVDVVLALPNDQLSGFTEKLFHMMTAYCHERREPMFQRDQYDAVIHGLSREIAVFKAAAASGFDVHMTSRVADSLGVDMQVRVSGAERYVNIDCKTPSAFRYRLHDLIREGRMTEAEAVSAMISGMAGVTTGHGNDTVRAVLMRVSPEECGEVIDFCFVDTTLVAGRLHDMIRQYGNDDGNFYRFAPDAN